MKTMTLLIIFACTFLTLSLTSSVYAESKTFSVSITIPSIPGVNAPPYADNSQTTPVNQAEASETAIAMQENAEIPQVIMEDDTKNRATGEGKFAQANVKTIYPR